RGDIKSQMDAYAVGVQWGWLSRADVREKMGEPIAEDQNLHEYLVPLNMTLSSKIGEAQQPSFEQASAMAWMTTMMRNDPASTEALRELDGISSFIGSSQQRMEELTDRLSAQGAQIEQLQGEVSQQAQV